MFGGHSCGLTATRFVIEIASAGQLTAFTIIFAIL